MKKLIYKAVILILGLMNMAMAQVKLGLKCSPQLTWISEESKSISSSGARLNLSYGLMIDKYFTDNYAFATEIGITTMSGNIAPQNVTLIKNSVGYQNPEYLYRLQYITIPVMLRMRTNEIGYLRYYAEFGMDFGFLFRSKANIVANNFSIDNVNINDPDPTDAYVINDNSSSRNITDKVRLFRSALLIGAGIQYSVFTNTLLVAGIRYQNSFTDFADDEAWKASLHSAALHLGVLF